MSARLLQVVLRGLDMVARTLPWNKSNEAAARHLRTGQRGEQDAYFWLRRHGYVMVARNWRSPGHRGEIDLIGWDGSVLCFIEVKTRSRRDDWVTAEAAVDRDKQHFLRTVAREYLRRLELQPGYRFDVVTVYYEKDHKPVITLQRNAFPTAE
jgi:putative endonuclease